MDTFGFLQHLARAARNFRTYPASSPLCTDAIAAGHDAFVALALEQPLLIRVTAQQLLVDDVPVAPDPSIDHELRSTLHAARVATLEFDRGTSARDLATLCQLLSVAVRPTREPATLAERLLDAGVGAIVPRMIPRPEVFEIGAPQEPVLRIVRHERERQATGTPQNGAAQYLYPPDKGWVRADPTFEDPSVSLLDLTLLVSDPEELAGMLARLADDTVDEAADADPLRERYDDIVTLIGALDPHVGRLLLSKLARGVLGLAADRRRALLRKSILPHLLDGRGDGPAVLAEFPDVELAEALGLLFDLEVASPQMLSVAFEHLALPADRRARVLPLVERSVTSSPGAPADRWAAAGFDARAAELIHVDGSAHRDFADFAAFDLAVDDSTRAALAATAAEVASADGDEAWLGCALALVRLEPNPGMAGAVLARARALIQQWLREGRPQDAARWLSRIAAAAGSLAPTRPDVATVVRDALARLCDRALLSWLASRSATDDGRPEASATIEALEGAIVPAWLEALASAADRSMAMRLKPLMCEHGRRLGRVLAQRLSGLPPDVAIVAVAVLGYAGPGCETEVSAAITGQDDALSREAFRALARIGSAKAAALIAWQIEHGTSQTAAEEALWRLPNGLALARAQDLLGRREFVTRHPAAAARLLERAAQGTPSQLEPLLETLAPLRFHFWNPALARVGAKARGLL